MRKREQAFFFIALALYSLFASAVIINTIITLLPLLLHP